jgi:hypothetical protein
MSPRNKRLEQPEPAENTPIRKWKRKEPASNAYRKSKGGFGVKDLPSGTITQHRAKPGKTSPQ